MCSYNSYRTKREHHLSIDLLPLPLGAKPGRGRKGRQPDVTPDPENDIERIFLWDLDETIILFLSYLNGNRVVEVCLQIFYTIFHIFIQF